MPAYYRARFRVVVGWVSFLTFTITVMLLEVLGCGDAFCGRRYNTSFLLREPDLLLIDGPQALFRLLAERDIDRDSLTQMVLTHVHGDHVSGFETLMLWNRFALKRRLRLITSAAVFEDVKEGFFSRVRKSFSSDLTGFRQRSLEDYIEWVEVSEREPVVLEGGTTIEIRHNWHPVATLGLRLSTEDGSISISGDTCFRPRLLEELLKLGVLDKERHRRLAGDWLWNADVVYHEASRGEQHSLHTLESDLLALPAEIRERLRLVHLADDYRSGSIPLAVEGERVWLKAEELPRIIGT